MADTSGGYPDVRLDELLDPVTRPEQVNPTTVYPLLGARWYAKGLFVKETKPGSQIQATTLYQVREGDFVYNRLFAWKGSFAVATADIDGCYVSNEFPCFVVDQRRLDSRFLSFYFQLEATWNEALGLSAGGTPTSRNRLKVGRLLDMTIPLPTLADQRRIAARIEALAKRVEAVRQLDTEIESDSQKLLSAVFWRLVQGASWKPLGEVAPLIRRPVEVSPIAHYKELGIRSFGKGTFHKAPVTGAELGSKRVFQVHPGDLLFSNVFAWEGAVAVARDEDQDRVGSHRFITCVPQTGIVTAKFLRFFFLTTEGLQLLGTASPGGAGRNRTLGLKALTKIELPVPDYESQLWFDSLQERFEEVSQDRLGRTVELDALLPSVLDRAFKVVL